jgi:quercetin dioxygenase-like cupin family protein
LAGKNDWNEEMIRSIQDMRFFPSARLVSFVITVCFSMQVAAEPTSEVLLTSDIKWEQLNPARGDKSPKAGTLWGDRNGTAPTGFLVKFAYGFSSPPHIHNVSYRGVVISGRIHNDDPDAADMWMPAGSFWAQPKGEVHITAARGSANMAYIEIEAGPYLVLPTEKAFDSGERPVNLDISNIVWMDASSITWLGKPGMSTSAREPKVSFLWGNSQDNQLSGTLIKLPAGFAGKINTRGPSLRAVIIKGRPQYQVPGGTDVKTMEPGSYFSSKGEVVHQVLSEADEECIIYVRSEGRFSITEN